MYCTIHVLQGKWGHLLELQGKIENGLCNVHGLEEKWGNVLELQGRWDHVLELGGQMEKCTGTTGKNGVMYWSWRVKMGYSTGITG
jgi:hypothetical protein